MNTCKNLHKFEEIKETDFKGYIKNNGTFHLTKLSKNTGISSRTMKALLEEYNPNLVQRNCKRFTLKNLIKWVKRICK